MNKKRTYLLFFVIIFFFVIGCIYQKYGVENDMKLLIPPGKMDMLCIYTLKEVLIVLIQ